MIVVTLKNGKKIAMAFCHPIAFKASGTGPILEAKGYRKTICELYEVGEVKGDRKFLCSATIRWPYEMISSKGLENGKERDYLTANHKFKREHGPKELMRLQTLAKAVRKLTESDDPKKPNPIVAELGWGLSVDDKEKIFDTYLMRKLHDGGPFLGGSGSASSPNPMSERVPLLLTQGNVKDGTLQTIH